MHRILLPLLIFLVGLAAPLWIGAGYLGHHAVGVAVALLIAISYTVGAMELWGYRRSTLGLRQALETPENDLANWLQRIPAELRGPLRMRIEGERVALPGPALTPYLVGLLVLLGMLGTLLGMMATLRGTGIALESATDLQAIRGSLASPVEGLAVAFGTSIAGVAASAMLGLLSALLRRERAQAVQALDAHIAGTLQAHSPAWQRAETVRLLQLQSAALPPLVERIEALVTGLSSAQQQQNEQLLARQAEFHQRSEAAQQRAASALESALQRGVEQSAGALVSNVQPLLQASLHGLAEEGARQQAVVEQAVQRQLDALQAGFTAASNNAAASWQAVLAEQDRGQQALLDAVSTTLDRNAVQKAENSEQLLGKVASYLQQQAAEAAAGWAQAQARQQQVNAELAAQGQAVLQQALDAQREAAAALLQQLGGNAQALQEQLAAQDAQRLEQWSQAFGSMAGTAGAQWQRSAELAVEQQQRICDALADAGRRIAEQTQAHASQTIAEIGRLVDAAAEAPRAAAEVVGELRQRLSESMVRDNTLLEERAQVLGTLQAVMEAINHASTQQRSAVDALIERATQVMQETGERFAEQVANGSGRLDALAGQLAEGAQGMGALASGLETAVKTFGEGSSQLSGHLETLAAALDATLARSDEQLAFYVAQAREVVELTLMSQKQVLDELQQLAAQPGAARA